jgi:hypothetical protein
LYAIRCLVSVFIAGSRLCLCCSGGPCKVFGCELALEMACAVNYFYSGASHVELPSIENKNKRSFNLKRGKIVRSRVCFFIVGIWVASLQSSALAFCGGWDLPTAPGFNSESWLEKWPVLVSIVILVAFFSAWSILRIRKSH